MAQASDFLIEKRHTHINIYNTSCYCSWIIQFACWGYCSIVINNNYHTHNIQLHHKPTQSMVNVNATQSISFHYNDVKMSAIASQITSLTIVCSTVYSGADQRWHQSSASLAFVSGIHRWPVNSPHKWPLTRKMLPFDYFIMSTYICM